MGRLGCKDRDTDDRDGKGLKRILLRASVFHGIIRLDGLLYPSANTEAGGINIVLQKHVIDNALIFADKAIMYKAQRSTNNSKHFSFVDASNEVDINPDGLISFQYLVEYSRCLIL